MSKDPGLWVKSSLSNENISCVEAAQLDGMIRVRDTKDQGRGPQLGFTRSEWEAFLAGAKAGDFDHLVEGL